MRRIFLVAVLLSTAYADEDLVHAIHGTIEKIDHGSETVVIKTGDGVKHSLHATEDVAVHDADASDKAATASWHGLTEGSEVVAHYTKRGTEESALEIDKIGKDGLKTAEGSIKELDRGGKKLVIDTGNGTKQTFRLTDHATEDAGKDIAKGAEEGTKVTVYYADDAGRKVAHFFEGP
ncbi:MAG: hypothetical protein ACLQLC_03245 [Candidatus Sulfotelmatobacter sp.]